VVRIIREEASAPFVEVSERIPADADHAAPATRPVPISIPAAFVDED
jgi:hypothetical protein